MSEGHNNGGLPDRDANGRFAVGRARGRQHGSVHKVTSAVRVLMAGQAEALTRMVIDAALAGDMVALKLCIERIAPAPKDTPVRFTLPPMVKAADAVAAAGAIVTAVAEGELTPIEGARVMGLIESFRRCLELSELEERITALEAERLP